MTQAASNYGQVLYERNVPKDVVEEAERIFRETPQLKKALVSPMVKRNDKYRVIDRVFQKELRIFLKVLCRHERMNDIEEVFEAYHVYACEKEGVLRAALLYVTKPDEAQLDKIRQMLICKYGKRAISLRLVKDESLCGGFVIRVGNTETDWSLKGKLKQLEHKLMRR